MPASPAPARRISGTVFTAIMLIVAAVLFYLVYLLEAPTSPFWALLAIGALALVFALVAYLLEAAIAQPMLGRFISWAFLGMGFTVLFVTITLYPDATVSTTQRVYLVLGALALLAIAVLGFYWRSGVLPAEAARTVERQSWQARPTVSAFDHSTANAPAVPPPSSSGAPKAPPGNP
jgi:hypothetical protein